MSVLSILAIANQVFPVIELVWRYFVKREAQKHLAATSKTPAG